MSRAVFNNDAFPDTDERIIEKIKEDISTEEKMKRFYYIVHTEKETFGMSKCIKRFSEKGSFVWCYDIHNNMIYAIPTSRITSINLLIE